MIKITSLQAIAAALLACGLSAAPGQAGPNRTWVSGTGTDTGTCPITAPCKSFAFALTQTAAGGEIDVLSPGGYGAVTILMAISIVNDGVGVTIVDSVASNNFDTGILALSFSSVTATAFVRNSVASSNSTGLFAEEGGNLLVAHSVVTGNNTGVNTFNSGVIFSYGDNDIDGNSSNNTGVLTVIPTH
jgi:hypothetical protein